MFDRFKNVITTPPTTRTFIAVWDAFQGETRKFSKADKPAR